MINQIEHFVTLLISDFLSRGNKTEVCFFTTSENCGNTILVATQKNGEERCAKLLYHRLSSRQRLALFLFVVAEVHELYLFGSHCTYRQLYYRNVNFECTMWQIRRAVADVCNILGTSPWNLGVFACGKCYVSGINRVMFLFLTCNALKNFDVFVVGPLAVHMSNGDVIDCSRFKGATLMPPNFTYIDNFETTASLVLVVEKYTVFQYLIANDIFALLKGNIILITARGYPDICTRHILQKLWTENRLNIYALVDCDPFGIEIMLIYRYGSLSQSQHGFYLSCPQLKWLGIHATDVAFMESHMEYLSTADQNKITSLLARSYLDDEIRKELLLLQRLQCKIKIDNLSSIVLDYITNKIKRFLSL